MADKTAFQKLYEKYLLAKRNPEMLRVMVARSGNTPCVVLTMDKTPIAKLLTKRELDTLEPDFDVSEIINDHYTKAAELDPRTKLEDFNVNSEFDHMFSHEVIDSLNLEW
jgi:hypothetical protein